MVVILHVIELFQNATISIPEEEVLTLFFRLPKVIVYETCSLS